MRTCKVEGCENKYYGKGYCKAHYGQVRIHGYVKNNYIRKKSNDIIIKDNYAEVVLRNSKGQEVSRAIVDIEDIEKTSKYTWSLHSKGYVRCMHKGHTTYLHRIILGLNPGSEEVDHINRDKLDNRKSNLRVCEHWVNAVNKTINNSNGCFGVCDTKRKLSKPYRVTLRRNNKTFIFGYYASFEEAKRVAVYGTNTLNKKYGIEA